jgi:hypothetical protein
VLFSLLISRNGEEYILSFGKRVLQASFSIRNEKQQYFAG